MPAKRKRVVREEEARHDLSPKRLRTTVLPTSVSDLLVENAPYGIVIIGGDGTISKVNLQTEKMFGYARCDLLGKPVELLLAERYRGSRLFGRPPDFQDHDVQQMAHGYESHGLRKDGTEFPIDIQLHPLSLTGHAVTIARIHDLTERETARKTEARLAAIVTSSSAGIIGLLPDGRIESWNCGAERLFGFGAGEAIGMAFRDLVPPDRSVEFDRTVEQLNPSRPAQDIESVHLHKDGTRIDVALTISLVKNGGDHITGSCIIVRDIRERKRLEQQIAEIADVERQRLGRELHDSLSQQITGLGMLATALQRDLPDGSPSAALAAKLESSLQEAKQQIRRVTKGISPVDIDAEGLRAALENLVRDTHDTYGVECTLDCREDAPLADNFAATQLFLVAREAIHNAVKHAHPRRIDIRLHADKGDTLHLLVRDDGTGISTESTDGMGLHIMRYRCGLIGGTLGVNSTGSGGTGVTCSVPRTQSKRS